MRKAIAIVVVLFTAGLCAAQDKKLAPALKPVVEAEEDVYRYEPANNGSGPMWSSGSSCLVRIGENVFASGLETLKELKPLNNCRWTLFARGPKGWTLEQADKDGRTREPCPLVGFPDGRLLLSANPTLSPGKPGGGPARPEILQFSAADPKAAYQTLQPAWEGKPPFTEHSYRSFAADGPSGELILFQNIQYAHAEWAFRDREGQWKAGQLVFPWGAEYEKPVPIRVCYPDVVLKSRAVHFCGVSDIVEPNLQWRAYKKKLTGRNWDYDFRRLFYTWTPDITQQKFRPWVEIASREKTGGWLFPGDLWVAPDNTVHVLWTERAIDERLRTQFFPGEKQSNALNYAQLRDGQVTLRRTILKAEEGGARVVPSAGRFQVTPDNRLFIVYFASGADAAGKSVSENRVLEMSLDGTPGEPVRLPLASPMASYYTATPRAGSPPSHILEMLGPRGDTMRYARVRLW